MPSPIRARSNVFLVLLVSLCLGGLLGVFFDPSVASLRNAIEGIPNLRDDLSQAWLGAQPALARGLVGALVFGLSAFFLIRFFMGGFARRVLRFLENGLRERKLLSYKHEALAKRRRVVDFEKGTLFLMDSYLERLAEAHAEREKYQVALASYADPMVQERLKYSFDQHQIKSERRRVAVLFSDIRGFTAMSERMMPEEVVSILNEYFTFATTAVINNKGGVNKFIGDAVMAIFEDPPAYAEGESAAKNAITAALTMVEEFRIRIPKWKARASVPFECDVGVGVHYGEAVLGNLGSNERMEYTAIGDTVNFASRLCGLAKGGETRVSEPCFERVHEFFDAQAMDPVSVKNKVGLHVTYVVTGRRRRLG